MSGGGTGPDWQPSEGPLGQGEAAPRGRQGGGTGGFGLGGRLWACLSPGPGHHAPWIPIICSRMRTLSARIFSASRSCCTPSPWVGGGGGSQGQGHPASVYCPSPPHARHFPPATNISTTVITGRTSRRQGWGSNDYSETRNLTHREGNQSPVATQPGNGRPGLHTQTCLPPAWARPAPVAACCFLCVPSFPENTLLWAEHLVRAHGSGVLCLSPSWHCPPERFPGWSPGREKERAEPRLLGSQQEDATMACLRFWEPAYTWAKDLVCRDT